MNNIFLIGPELQNIFLLEKMLKEAGYPYFFNFREEDPDDVNYELYNFMIEVGRLAGYTLPMIRIRLSKRGNPYLLELLDMRRAAKRLTDPKEKDGDLLQELTPQECMMYIERMFDSL